MEHSSRGIVKTCGGKKYNSRHLGSSRKVSVVGCEFGVAKSPLLFTASCENLAETVLLMRDGQVWSDARLRQVLSILFS
jgi:hypothetical protein